MLNKKKFHFIKKNFPKKVTSRHNMKPNTHTRQEYKGKIYVNKNQKKSCRIRIGTDPKKIIPDPQHCI